MNPLALLGLGLALGIRHAADPDHVVTTGFAAPFTLAARRWPGLDRGIRFVTGTLSIAFGLWLAWQIGVVDGLFTATPHWTPQ